MNTLTKSQNLVLKFNEAIVAEKNTLTLENMFDEKPSDLIREEMRTHFYSIDHTSFTDIAKFNADNGFTPDFKDAICK